MYCILHGAANETTNGTQNKNVKNICNPYGLLCIYYPIIIFFYCFIIINTVSYIININILLINVLYIYI